MTSSPSCILMMNQKAFLLLQKTTVLLPLLPVTLNIYFCVWYGVPHECSCYMIRSWNVEVLDALTRCSGSYKRDCIPRGGLLCWAVLLHLVSEGIDAHRTAVCTLITMLPFGLNCFPIVRCLVSHFIQTVSPRNDLAPSLVHPGGGQNAGREHR